MNGLYVLLSIVVIQLFSLVTSDLTGTEEAAIVEGHNLYRAKAALGRIQGDDGEYLPQAAKMYPLVWNDNLATSAQEWADECEWGHTPKPWTDGAIAESIAYSTENNVGTAVRQWFGEIEDYSWGDPYNGNVRPYNAHLWYMIADYHGSIGCGYAYCQGEYYDHRVVCRYGPKSGASTSYTYPYEESSSVGSKCVYGFDRITGLCNWR